MTSLGRHVKFMRQLHQGQKDKIGAPYWRHPLRVMKILCHEMRENQPEPEFRHILLATALFHDVLEDVENGHKRLDCYLQAEIPAQTEAVLNAVRLLTKSKGASYDDYVVKILVGDNSYAKAVKLADLQDHLERLPLIRDADLRARLLEKYGRWQGQTSIRQVITRSLAQKVDPLTQQFSSELICGF